MAGGRAERMGGVEKPMVMLDQKPLIGYVIEALLASPEIGTVYVALTDRTPGTWEHLNRVYNSEPRLQPVLTPGVGYVEDTVYVVRMLELYRPFLIISSDLPLVTPDAIDIVLRKYKEAGTEALSVRVDAAVVPPGIRTDTVLTDGGVKNVPAAINIIDGRYMDRYQTESVFIVSDARLATNINYESDLAYCEKILKK